MIKILIIDDSVEKLRAVLNFLEKECNVSEIDIDCADTVNSGRDYLTKNSYDLLLLDLVLPINEDDSPTAESGTKFLDEIYYNPNINIPLHIIGLTEYDQAFKESAQDFEDKLWGLVNFSLQTNDWKDKLKSKVFYLQKTKTDYKKFIEVEKKFDVAIITALNKEFEELKSICTWEPFPVKNDPLVYYKFTLNTKNSNNIKIIACCVNDMGMQAASAVTSKIISTFSPSLVFMTGICAGLKSAGVNLGGIIVAKQVWDYESGKIIDGDAGNFTFKPDMKCIPTDQGIVTRLIEFSNNKTAISNIYNEFKGKKPNTQLEVKFDSVGSGPYLLTSKNYLTKLLENDRKLIGIDMEGYGMYKAAQFHQGTTPVLVKAVSDFGDAEKDDDYQSYASYASARFVYEYLYNSF
jgi:nucleoside phosphorylase